MIGMKLLWLVLIIGLAVFAVLYVDSFAVMLLLTALALPLLLLLTLVWIRFTARGELLCDTPVSATEGTVPLTIAVTSRCPLAFPRAEAMVEIRHAFGEKPERLKLCFPLRGNNTARITFYIRTDCCGTVQVAVQKLRVMDYLCLFSARLPIPENTHSVTVLPKRLQLTVENSAAPAYCEDSEVYAEGSGDDPSEICSLREYAEGDPVSRIHWKLSSKLDRTMLREFGMPVQKSVLLTVEHVPPAEMRSLEAMRHAEAVLSLAYSIACVQLESGIPFTILWQSPTAGVMRRSPESPAELTDCLRVMFLAAADMPLLPDVLAQETAAYSAILCVSNHPSEALLQTVEQRTVAAAKTVIFVSESSTAAPSMSGTAVYYVPPEDPVRELPPLIV